MREYDESYVLRIWKESPNESGPRASLRKLQSADTKYFSDMTGLVKHIKHLENQTKT